MLASMSQAVALEIVVSKSLARRRLRVSQAKVRSTTQRRFGNTNPFFPSGFSLTSIAYCTLWCTIQVAKVLLRYF